MAIKELVKEVLEQENEEAKERTKERVRSIVRELLSTKECIAKSVVKISVLKKELDELGYPVEKTLEL